MGSIFGGGGKPDTSGQEAAAAQANALQKQMYEESVARSEPFYQAGVSGMTELQRLMGLGGDAGSQGYGSLTQGYSPEMLTEDPSYQFRQTEGQKAIDRAMAAGGKTFSPEAVKALQGYNQNLASTEYGQAFDRNRATQGDLYNRLAGISGTGQQQVSGLQQAGQSYAGNVGQTNTSLADSMSAAQQQAQQGRSSMFGTLGSLAGMGVGYALGDPTGKLGKFGGSMLGGQIGGAAGRYI